MLIEGITCRTQGTQAGCAVEEVVLDAKYGTTVFECTNQDRRRVDVYIQSEEDG